MLDLLNDVAARAARYSGDISRRPVAPPQSALDGLAELDTPLPEDPSSPSSVLELLDRAGSPATVASSTSNALLCAEIGPDRTTRSIAFEEPKVDRTERSNSASAVSTTMRVPLALALGVRPRRITSPDYLTGVAGAVTVGPTGAALF